MQFVVPVRFPYQTLNMEEKKIIYLVLKTHDLL
jgi:hypothetical protein